MLRLALHRATTSTALKTPKSISKFYTTDSPQSTNVARQMIDYSFNLARSQRSGEAYNQAMMVLEQGVSNFRGEGDDAVGMLMLAMSSLLYERGEFDDAMVKLKMARGLENTTLPVKAAAWQGLVGLNLELGLDNSSLVLADDCFPLLRKSEESNWSASDALTTGIRATKGLADLVIGNLDSAEVFFNGCVDDKTEDGIHQLGNVFLSRGEFLHCTGSLRYAKELYEKAVDTYETKGASGVPYVAAANMSPEEIHLGATCALGQVLSHLGESDAEEVLTKALKMAEDHFGSTHPKIGVVLTCIALMFRHRAKREGSSSILIQEGLYRKVFDLLKAPDLDTEVADVPVNRRDIIALARGGYADILLIQQNRKGEGEQMRKWAEAAWSNKRLSLAEALESAEPVKAAVIDTRICRVI